ncbi:MAG TPA: DUF4177 domain-containing protein [Roseiflexaceae bacterium]|nr:DUF4177 domain-containing protein [Roseiflexaceae bacterium]
MSSEGTPTTRLGGPEQRWDYRVMLMSIEGLLGQNIDLDALRNYLDEAGDQGWELISVLPISRHDGRTSELLGIMKRPR